MSYKKMEHIDRTQAKMKKVKKKSEEKKENGPKINTNAAHFNILPRLPFALLTDTQKRYVLQLDRRIFREVSTSYYYRVVVRVRVRNFPVQVTNVSETVLF